MSTARKAKRLSDVADPQGRLDVVVYRVAAQWAEKLEADHGWKGICECLLPLVEQVIIEHIPAQNLIPREIAAVLRVCALNQGRKPS